MYVCMYVVFQIITVQAILAIVAWSPYAALCLQFLVRNPGLTTATMASFPPLFAKGVIGIMPLVYKANIASAKSSALNGIGQVDTTENDKIKWLKYEWKIRYVHGG